ncbi:MAG: hypothetical protein WKG01_22535 [Kofleriaceae bacterium]
MQRFELAGTPGRFWEVSQEAARVRLRWGPLTGGGQALERAFASETEAAVYIAQQIAAQRARGYVEVELPVRAEAEVLREQRFDWTTRAERKYRVVSQRGPVVGWQGGTVGADGTLVAIPSEVFRRTFPSVAEASVGYGELVASIEYDGAVPVDVHPPATIHANPELEALCEGSPDSPDPWAVYADWLIAQGDPRGEVAALHLAGKPAAARRVLAAHYAQLCGNEERPIALELRHGFAVAATLTIDRTGVLPLDVLTQQVLDAPIARFLQSLRFGLAHFESHTNTWRPTLDAVLRAPHASRIRERRFDAYSYQDCELSWTTFGDFSTAWPALANLELLHLRSGAGGTLGTIVLPNLRTFIRESGGLTSTELAAIASADWPRLAHLEIWTGSSNHGSDITLHHLVPILAGRGLPALRHLGIVNSELSDSLIAELARSEILPQLHSLDLSRGVMAQVAADSLVAHAAAFRHLASLDLSANVLERAEIDRIRAVLDNVITVGQRERDEDEYEDDELVELGRYVSIGE